MLALSNVLRENNAMSSHVFQKSSSDTDPDKKGITRAAQTLSAISNPQRLQILCHLVNDKELSVTELLQRLPLSQSALSQHLARLRLVGLVETRKDKQTVYYSIAQDDVQRIIALLHDLYCGA